MALQRLHRILGAARIESAHRRQQPRQGPLVEPERAHEHIHCLIDSRRGGAVPARRELSCRASSSCSRSCANVRTAADGLHWMTNHVPLAAMEVASRIALQRRRRRLRSTALPTFFVITIPTFDRRCDPRGMSAKTTRLFVEDARPRRSTSANSRRPRRLEYWRTATLIGCEPLAPFAPARGQHALPALARHASAETVRALTAAVVWLIGSFQETRAPKFVRGCENKKCAVAQKQGLIIELP